MLSSLLDPLDQLLNHSEEGEKEHEQANTAYTMSKPARMDELPERKEPCEDDQEANDDRKTPHCHSALRIGLPLWGKDGVEQHKNVQTDQSVGEECLYIGQSVLPPFCGS